MAKESITKTKDTKLFIKGSAKFYSGANTSSAQTEPRSQLIEKKTAFMDEQSNPNNNEVFRTQFRLRDRQYSGEFRDVFVEAR